MEEMDAALNLRAPFIGEFGMASCPNRESVYRYIPAEERGMWDPAAKNAFNYHTPRFNEFRWPEDYNDMDHLLKRAEEFGPIDSLDDFIFGTQMAQSTAIRHTLEAARAAWPQAAGICYYKLTDVYPACSWATVDYYGVPKSSYYVLAQAFAPLHAMLLIRSIHAAERYPLYLLDDAGEAAGRRCAVTVQFFDGGLRLIGSETREIVPTAAVNPLGDVALPAALAGDGPVLIHVRLTVDGVQADDTVYWQNYKENPGCLKALPSAALEVREAGAGYARIVNTGSVPAAGVLVECPAHDTEFTCDAGVFWLDAAKAARWRSAIPTAAPVGVQCEGNPVLINPRRGAGPCRGFCARYSNGILAEMVLPVAGRKAFAPVWPHGQKQYQIMRVPAATIFFSA